MYRIRGRRLRVRSTPQVYITRLQLFFLVSGAFAVFLLWESAIPAIRVLLAAYVIMSIMVLAAVTPNRATHDTSSEHVTLSHAPASRHEAEDLAWRHVIDRTFARGRKMNRGPHLFGNTRTALVSRAMVEDPHLMSATAIVTGTCDHTTRRTYAKHVCTLADQGLELMVIERRQREAFENPDMSEFVRAEFDRVEQILNE